MQCLLLFSMERASACQQQNMAHVTRAVAAGVQLLFKLAQYAAAPADLANSETCTKIVTTQYL
jgi:hypothetical protein